MRNHFFAIVILSCALTLSACSGGQTEANTSQQRRLNQQQEEINKLKSQLSSAQSAQAETWSQTQNLRQELSVINGKLDDFNYAASSVGGLSSLAQRLKKIEEAMRKLERQFDIKLLGVATGQAGSSKSAPAVQPPAGQSSAAQPSAAQLQAKAVPAQKNAPANMDPSILLYESGIRLFNERKYKESLKAFTDFTKAYGAHKLAVNAWFWRGEANYQLGNYPAAALDYEQVISKFPKGAKTASAYLKQGLCFYRTGKKDAGKFRLEELLKIFPNTPEAKRAKQILMSGIK